MRIDFVSDIACPWCAIGLHSLEIALTRLQGVVEAEWHFQPFELNPDMAPEGEDIIEHIGRKYGATPEQTRRNQEAIRERGAAVGFTFAMDKRTRIHNTFDAHRLLHWAGLEGDRQRALKHALLEAYFTRGENPGDAEVLARAAERAGLDPARAREIVTSGEYGAAVRHREGYYLERGIHSVPAVIIDGRHLIQGGQPPEVFEEALRRLATQQPA
ncbi:MAG: DsbA family oxidoreductase [Proteobacteria bacterium]|nr:DsbA family oxidoreductase [Pseudomonadota bacterium]